MAFTVVYDANVPLPGQPARGAHPRRAGGLVQAKWTDQILDETFGNLKHNRPDLAPARVDRTQNLMNAAIRDVLVTDYQPLIETSTCPTVGFSP